LRATCSASRIKDKKGKTAFHVFRFFELNSEEAMLKIPFKRGREKAVQPQALKKNPLK
jgi:hypothetical protein